MAAEEPEPTEDPIPDGYVVSYLTGEYVPEAIGRRRPVAVMLNNLRPACPQAGIANAGVVYEAPVEGGITRLMGVFEDYDNLEKIGSVRSCRDYYIFYASGFDAIYTHYGQSAYALPFLELPEVNNISGLAGYGDQVFYRTTDRKSPHNAYTSFEGIQKGIEINGYSQEYAEDFQPGYAFCGVDDEVELPGETEANVVKPGYFLNEPWFEYNPEDKLYYRFQYGDKQIDQLTGEQIAYKNIILQYSSWRKYDEHGYLNIDVDEPNVGKYIVNGKAIDITWKNTPHGELPSTMIPTVIRSLWIPVRPGYALFRILTQTVWRFLVPMTALLPPQIHKTVKHRQQQKKLQHRILNIKMIIFTE